MKLIFTLSMRCALIFCAALSCNVVLAQTHTPKTVRITGTCGGYYEYLPQDYATAGKHPLIIFLHGRGDLGNGSAADMEKLFQYQCLPLYIRQDKFPDFFTVSGKTFSFVVVSPQFSSTPSAQDVNEVITYALNTYKDKVDPTRVYVTGCSMGGGAVWNFARASVTNASRAAAIVPICGDSDPTTGPAVTPIPATNLPVWALHNIGDRIVQVVKTNNYIDAINNYRPASNPAAKKTIFPFESSDLTLGHDAWTKSYDPTFKEDGMNIYEWMLQYTRGTDAVLPVTLGFYDTYVNDLNQVIVRWTTTFEQNNKAFSIERSVDGTHFTQIGTVAASNISTGSSYSYTDTDPVKGVNYYRLKQTDLDGKTTWFAILQEDILAEELNSFKLYPNPSSSVLELVLNTGETGKIQVSVINMDGRLMNSQTFNKAQSYWKQQIPVSSLGAGQYILEVKGETINSRKIFIKR